LALVIVVYPVPGLAEAVSAMPKANVFAAVVVIEAAVPVVVVAGMAALVSNGAEVFAPLNAKKSARILSAPPFAFTGAKSGRSS